MQTKNRISIKNVVNGILIGMVNPIPGVSGGTIMVLLGIFDDIIKSISNLFSKNKKSNIRDIIFLAEIFLGIAIGVVSFSNILQFLYTNFLPQTMCWFSGLVLFSVPVLVKNELSDKKINYKYFFLGIILIITIFLFSKNSINYTNTSTNINFIYVIEMFFIGFISGAVTIFPGISGSMVLLLIDKYYIYNYYLATSISLNSSILIPLSFIIIGILIGTICSSKISNYLLNKHKKNTMSLIIGFVFISSIVIVPFNYKFNMIDIVTSLFTFLLGGYIITFLTKIKKNNH